jgi:hypothetical protein
MPIFERPSPQAVTKFGLAGGMGILGYDVSDGDYQAQYQEWAVERGYRLVDLWGYSAGGPNSNVPLFAFILEEYREHPSQFTQHMIPYEDYQSVFKEQKAQGYAPVRVCVYSLGEQTLVAAIFEQQGAWRTWQAKHDFLISDLPGHLMAVEKMGYRIRDLNAYSVLEADPSNSSGPKKWIAHFSSVWKPSDGREWVISMPTSLGSYQDTYNQNTALGFFPVQISGYGPEPSFVGRWEKNPSYSGLWLPSSAAYQTAIDNSDLVGMRPASAGAFSQVYSNTPPLTTLDPGAFCGLWARRTADSVIPGLVSEFLKVYQIPGLSLAVAYQGKLAYAGAFGTADGSTGAAVPTTSTLRIASITKPITATAIFLLVAGNKLGLDDLVFGPRGHLSALGQPIDSRATLITVRDLLEHTSGGWPQHRREPRRPHVCIPRAERRGAHHGGDHQPGTRQRAGHRVRLLQLRVLRARPGDRAGHRGRLRVLGPVEHPEPQPRHDDHRRQHAGRPATQRGGLLRHGRG